MTNRLGFHYYPSKPDNCRPGVLEDFLYDGKKKVGMEYLVYSELKDQYQVYVVREATTGKKIKEFIDNEILYVFT